MEARSVEVLTRIRSGDRRSLFFMARLSSRSRVEIRCPAAGEGKDGFSTIDSGSLCSLFCCPLLDLPFCGWLVDVSYELGLRSPESAELEPNKSQVTVCGLLMRCDVECGSSWNDSLVRSTIWVGLDMQFLRFVSRLLSE